MIKDLEITKYNLSFKIYEFIMIPFKINLRIGKDFLNITQGLNNGGF